MTTTFENQVKLWTQTDIQIKELNDKLKHLREQRDTLERSILAHTVEHNINLSNLQVGNNKLKVTNSRLHEPLTFKYLEKSLGEIIKNESQVKKIIEYVKQHREIQTISEIKRFPNN